jgi:hypothetical protein
MRMVVVMMMMMMMMMRMMMRMMRMMMRIMMMMSDHQLFISHDKYQREKDAMDGCVWKSDPAGAVWRLAHSYLNG